MALWVVKRTQSPTPASSGGLVGVEVYLLDKQTGTQAHVHVEPNATGDGTFDYEEVLTLVEAEGYTPNDFGL